MSKKPMAKKRNYRNFRDVEEDYFRKRPDEIPAYMDEIFDECAQDDNSSNAAFINHQLEMIRRLEELAAGKFSTHEIVKEKTLGVL